MQASAHTAQYATQPQRPAPAGAWWKSFVVAIVVWTVVAFLAAAADHSDALRAARASAFSAKLVLYAGVFVPFALVSGLLAFAFERSPVRLAQPRTTVLFYLAILAVFLPIYGMYEVALILSLERQPVPPLVQLLGQQSAWGRWLDGTMITMAYAAQLAYAYWLRGQQQAIGAQRVRSANLALRLSLLQGQLEPYFLLSSLEGIGALVRDAERSLATRALARLSDLLRYALRSGMQEKLSVADEIGFVHDYLDLQALRFGQRLRVGWETEPIDWSAHACPALLLHPLLERALAHALARPDDSCAMRLSFSMRGTKVCVAIEYSHAGEVSDAQLALVPVRERLALLYGGEAEVDHVAGLRATRTALTFPAREHDDE